MAELSNNTGGAGCEIRKAGRGQITDTGSHGKAFKFYTKPVGKPFKGAEQRSNMI